MLRDRVQYYLNELGYNCAEATLRLANEAFELHLSDDVYKAVGVFGSGLASGDTCGAVAAASAVLGLLYTEDRFNLSPDARTRVQTLIARVRQECGDTQCRVLRPRYAEPEIRCLHLVERVADLLEEVAEK